MSDLDAMNISTRVVDSIREILPKGGTILEIGTGKGTRLLTSRWKVYSVEHNPAWHVSKSTLIKVPLLAVEKTVPRDNVEFWNRFPRASRWYHPEILKEKLKGISYDLILVDGPPNDPRRIGMWWYYPLIFDTSVPVVVDDVHREYDWQVAVKIAETKGVKDFKIEVTDDGTYKKMFAIIK